MRNLNNRECIICGQELKDEITIGNSDELCVNCDSCGKYKITREFFDDFLLRDDSEKTKGQMQTYIRSQYDNHKKTIPYFSIWPFQKEKNIEPVPYEKLRKF